MAVTAQTMSEKRVTLRQTKVVGLSISDTLSEKL